MSESLLVAPSLSTTQTDETFRFDVYKNSHNLRKHLDQDRSKVELTREICEYYSVSELIKFFNEHLEYKNITLQFPDDLVVDSATIAEQLQIGLKNDSTKGQDTSDSQGDSCCRTSTCCKETKVQCLSSEAKTDRKVWILADTSYSACCVDEVASEHVNGDIVVHFGDACLNEVARLPVLYSFGKPKLDRGDFIAKFNEKYPNRNTKVCLMANAPYSFHLEELYFRLQEQGYQNILYADINTDTLSESIRIIDFKRSEKKALLCLGNRSIFGNAEDVDTDEDLKDSYELFHISKPQDPHMLYLTTKFQAVTIYDPSANTLFEGPFPSMMKRYRFMHVARTAGTIGILINTLSLRNTKRTINELIHLIKQNGKKHYLFVVGKPNVAKLANFEAIDVWCVIGCGQGGIILDQYNEFYKPIVTPYELITALNVEITWTGKWVVDFKAVLDEMESDDQPDNENPASADNVADDHDAEDAPEFDPVTGKYVSTSRPLRNVTRLEIHAPSEEINSSDGSDLLVKQFSGSVAIRNTVSTSAHLLQNRHWTGLGSDYHNDEEIHEADGATLEDGISGIARGYDIDLPNVSSKNQ